MAHRNGWLVGVLLAILVLTTVLAILASWLASADPGEIDLSQLDQPPSRLHWLGTDRLGRDVWSRLLFGARATLGAGLLATALSTGVGLLVGAVAGYAPSWLDGLLMRLSDLVLALPTFFLLIAIQALVPPRLLTVAAIIALTSWMPLARLVRGRLLSLRARDFVLAAQATGCSAPRIVWRHLLPNALGEIALFSTLTLSDAILVESALSFLGLGLPPDLPSWGNMLTGASAAILNGSWWTILFPGLAILLVTASANLLGDELILPNQHTA